MTKNGMEILAENLVVKAGGNNILTFSQAEDLLSKMKDDKINPVIYYVLKYCVRSV